jgi:hypothetical protein
MAPYFIIQQDDDKYTSEGGKGVVQILSNVLLVPKKEQEHQMLQPKSDASTHSARGKSSTKQPQHRVHYGIQPATTSIIQRSSTTTAAMYPNIIIQQDEGNYTGELEGGRCGNFKNQNDKMQILSNVVLVPKSAGGKLINVQKNVLSLEMPSPAARYAAARANTASKPLAEKSDNVCSLFENVFSYLLFF